MSRTPVAVAVALVLASAALLVPAANAASPTPSPTPSARTAAGSKAATKPVTTFGIQPYSVLARNQPGVFLINASAGAHVGTTAEALNYSFKPLVLRIGVQDAVNTDTGGFGLVPSTSKTQGIASWTKLAPRYRVVTVPARASARSKPGKFRIPFDVYVPLNATPGEHVGGIVATLRAAARSGTGQLFKLDQSVGSRIFVTVSGTLRPNLVIENLHATYHASATPGGLGYATVSYRVHNTGNVALGGRQTLRVHGPFGVDVSPKVGQVPLLVPGGSAPFSGVVRGLRPVLRLQADVSIAPLVVPGSNTPPSGPYTASTTFWAIPWSLIGLIVLLVLLALAWWLLRRRRSDGQSGGNHRRREGDDGLAATAGPEPDSGELSSVGTTDSEAIDL